MNIYDNEQPRVNAKDRVLRKRASRRNTRRMVRDVLAASRSELDTLLTDPIIEGELPDAAAAYIENYHSHKGHY